LPREANPYLGVRAIRVSRLRPDIFITQVRAILRAATQHPIRILLPMVTLIEELQQARNLIEQAHQELLREGILHAWEIPLGIMVETPAAALLADQFAPLVDFFSIGTNDLTQYTLAAERGNPDVAHLYDALHPAILQLIQRVAQAAHQHHKWAGVCGEVAADPLAVPILIGMDLDELSVNVAAVPQVKAIIRGLGMPEVRELAQIALRASTAPEVHQSSRAFLESRGLLF
jgi:phosphoenolpyruvate-protein kinase (PTS system EI component)